MQKKIGDSLEYEDERGNQCRAIAATFPASILQGLVVVDETAFIDRFPKQCRLQYVPHRLPTDEE
jgi:hypothetical protein